MKAIIEIAKNGSSIRAARQQIKASKLGEPVNFRLAFESAKLLFNELTPSRFDLLDILSKAGACHVDALVKLANRNALDVDANIKRLEELSLIDRTEDGQIFVPFDAIEIFMPLAKVA